MINNVQVEVNMVVNIDVLKKISEKKLEQELDYLDIDGINIDRELFRTEDWTINNVRITRIL